jgi:hypothetical protein
VEEDGYTSLCDNKTGAVKEDLRITNDELRQRVIERFNKGDNLTVTVLKAMEEEAIIDCKTTPEDK